MNCQELADGVAGEHHRGAVCGGRPGLPAAQLPSPARGCHRGQVRAKVVSHAG